MSHPLPLPENPNLLDMIFANVDVGQIVESLYAKIRENHEIPGRDIHYNYIEGMIKGVVSQGKPFANIAIFNYILNSEPQLQNHIREHLEKLQPEKVDFYIKDWLPFLRFQTNTLLDKYTPTHIEEYLMTYTNLVREAWVDQSIIVVEQQQQ